MSICDPAIHCVKLVLDHPEFLTALATVVLAFFTWRLAVATNLLAQDTKEIATKQVGVNVWLVFSEKFDSDKIQKNRKNLANEFLSDLATVSQGYKKSEKPNLVSNNLMGFFEDLGTVYNQNVIHTQLTDETFCYHVRRWWLAVKEDVDQIRKKHPNMKLFCEFEKMASSMEEEKDEPISPNQLSDFLTQESNVK
jgi:uncharacterized UBP type Zn finger protein